MKKILVIFGILFVSAVLVVYFRNIGPDRLILSDSSSTFPCIEGDPVRGHRLKPGCHAKALRVGNEIDVRVNSLELRGPEIGSLEKGETRILMLGPSGMFGVAAEEEQTIPKLVERKLEAFSGKRFEVLNAGMEGYYVLQQYLRFEHLLANVHPQVVVLSLFYEGGFFKDFVTYQSCKKDAAGLPIACSIDAANGLPSFLARIIYRSPGAFFLAYTAKLFLNRIRASRELAALSPQERADRLVNAVLPSLKKMKQLCEARGIKFFVFMPGVGAKKSIYIGGFLNRHLANVLFNFEHEIEFEGAASLIELKLRQNQIPLLPNNSTRLEEWVARRYISFTYPQDFHPNGLGDEFISNWMTEDLKLELGLKK